MENVGDTPTKHAPPPESTKSTEKKDWLYNSLFQILDKFVMGDIGAVTFEYQLEGICTASSFQ